MSSVSFTPIYKAIASGAAAAAAGYASQLPKVMDFVHTTLGHHWINIPVIPSAPGYCAAVNALNSLVQSGIESKAKISEKNLLIRVLVSGTSLAAVTGAVYFGAPLLGIASLAPEGAATVFALNALVESVAFVAACIFKFGQDFQLKQKIKECKESVNVPLQAFLTALSEQQKAYESYKPNEQTLTDAANAYKKVLDDLKLPQSLQLSPIQEALDANIGFCHTKEEMEKQIAYLDGELKKISEETSPQWKPIFKKEKEVITKLLELYNTNEAYKQFCDQAENDENKSYVELRKVQAKLKEIKHKGALFVFDQKLKLVNEDDDTAIKRLHDNYITKNTALNTAALALKQALSGNKQYNDMLTFANEKKLLETGVTYFNEIFLGGNQNAELLKGAYGSKDLYGVLQALKV